MKRTELRRLYLKKQKKVKLTAIILWLNNIALKRHKICLS